MVGTYVLKELTDNGKFCKKINQKKKISQIVLYISAGMKPGPPQTSKIESLAITFSR